MKNVLLSADSRSTVYSVPDIVYEKLDEYCITFCRDRLHKSPDAAEYRAPDCVCYDETDFIKYLNTWIFPNEQSKAVETLDWSVIGNTMNFGGSLHLPEKYRDCKRFQFLVV